MAKLRLSELFRAKRPSRRGPFLFVVVLSCFAACNSAVWSLTIPAGQAPDEPNHFSVAQFTVDHGRIPEFERDPGMGVSVIDPEGARVGNFSYAAAPQLPYVISAAFIALPTDGEWMDYRQARTPGALWLALIVVFGFLLAHRVTGSTLVAGGTATMLAAWPQLTFVSAYVNTDTFTLMASTGLMWSWWRGWGSGWRIRDAVLSGFFIGLVLQGKPTGYVIAGLTLIVVAATLRGSWRFISTRLLAAGLAVVATAGWWLVTAASMYGWDLLSLRRQVELADELNLHSGASRDAGLSVAQMLFDAHWIDIASRSFVGTFGWMTMPINGWLYGLVLAIMVMGTVGIAMRVVDRVRARSSWWNARTMVILCTTAPIIIVPIMAIRSSYTLDFQAQGRYLFAALPGLVMLTCWGLATLGLTTGRARSLVALGALAVVSVNIVALLDTLVPGHSAPLSQWWHGWQAAILVAWIGCGLGALVLAGRCIGWSASRATEPAS